MMMESIAVIAAVITAKRIVGSIKRIVKWRVGSEITIGSVPSIIIIRPPGAVPGMVIRPPIANRESPRWAPIVIPIPVGTIIIIDDGLAAAVGCYGFRLRGGLYLAFVNEHGIAVHRGVINDERFFERGVTSNRIGVIGTRRMVHVISLIVRGEVRVAAREKNG